MVKTVEISLKTIDNKLFIEHEGESVTNVKPTLAYYFILGCIESEYPNEDYDNCVVVFSYSSVDTAWRFIRVMEAASEKFSKHLHRFQFKLIPEEPATDKPLTLTIRNSKSDLIINNNGVISKHSLKGKVVNDIFELDVTDWIDTLSSKNVPIHIVCDDHTEDTLTSLLGESGDTSKSLLSRITFIPE